MILNSRAAPSPVVNAPIHRSAFPSLTTATLRAVTHERHVRGAPRGGDLRELPFYFLAGFVSAGFSVPAGACFREAAVCWAFRRASACN